MAKMNKILTGKVIGVLPSEENLNEAGVLTVLLPNDESAIIPIEEAIEKDENLNARHIARMFMGREIIGKVIQEYPLILSRNQAIEERRQAIDIQVGQELGGVAIWINRKQAIIEYNNCINVVMPAEEYCHLRIGNLSDVVKPGQKIKFEVLEVSDDKIIVSHKKYTDDPWPAIKEKYRIHGQYLGRVKGLIKSGIFVQLEKGLDVLASPYPFFEVAKGDEVALEISDIDSENAKIKGLITSLVSAAAVEEGRL